MTVTAIDAKPALILLDLQTMLVGAPCVPHTGQEVVTRSVALAEAFREQGAQVILVRVTYAEDKSDMTQSRTDTPRYTGAMPDAWDELVEEVSGHPADIVIAKRGWDAFYGTELDLHLRRRGISQIVLAGIATSVAIESTARTGYELGYHVVLAVDAMTDFSAEAHGNSVERIFPNLGETGTTDEIVQLLEKSRA